MSHAMPGAAVAPLSIGTARASRLHQLILLLLAFSIAVTLLAIAPPQPAEAGTTEASRIVAEAREHLGKPWKFSATGLKSFDCSGLVYRVFKERNLLERIGGSRKTVRGYYRWFKSRGLVSRYNPRVGDLVVWGDNKHIGIYVGKGMAISTLTSGVTRHGVHRLTNPLKAYLRVNLSR